VFYNGIEVQSNAYVSVQFVFHFETKIMIAMSHSATISRKSVA